MRHPIWRSLLHPNVLVAALGYFVDTYDLLLFTIIRRPSLEALGYSGAELVNKGIWLLDFQMIGMLLGGLLWGALGDKKGRLSVLFGSIIIYSLANLANAWVSTIEMYGALRFIAGFGLAGELGAAVTLVSEVLPTEHRSYATGLVATAGAAGAVLAAAVGELMPWQTAYIVGGVMGLMLLLLRVRAIDSTMFAKLRSDDVSVQRGNVLMLLNPRRLPRFVACILAGAPLWFMAGVLVTFAPELTRDLGVTGEVKVGIASLAAEIGLMLGDVITSVLSHYLRSRKKVIIGAIMASTLFMFGYLTIRGASPLVYYALLLGVGLCVGFWAVLVTTTAEQFGTNLRVTATTNAPNLVRTLVIPMSLGISALQGPIGLRFATMVVAACVIATALTGGFLMKETFGRDLAFTE